MSIVYHYTSIDTLFNIIKNQSVWLMDLHSSMDKNELDYAENLIKELSKTGIEDLTFLPTINFYALSCTSCKDSYFHFNSYGDSCKGVAIGINTQFMRDALNEDCERELKYHLNFYDVIYNEEIQRQKIIYELSYSYDFDFLNQRRLTRIYNNFWPIFRI